MFTSLEHHVLPIPNHAALEFGQMKEASYLSSPSPLLAPSEKHPGVLKAEPGTTTKYSPAAKCQGLLTTVVVT